MQIWTADAWAEKVREEERTAAFKEQAEFDADLQAMDREIARDKADRHSDWLIFVSEFFATCRAIGEAPWRDTGTHPMTFASQVYAERKVMQEAFINNGMWEPETLQVPDPSFTSIDPDQVFCEVDWDDNVTYQAAA